MATKKVLAMQDLSCVGQCSLTVVSPILSALGVEACVLPTAVLSNHTMFSEWSYLDLTDEIKKIFEVWKKQNFKFDAFLLGYLGKPALMETAKTCFRDFSAPGAKKIIDPVFADNGKLYGGFDMGYVEEMGKLITYADVILPNVTEACYLTGMEYRAVQDKEYLETLAYRLSAKTNAIIVITGAEFDGQMGEIILDGGKVSYVMRDKLPKLLHGTGDIFAAAFGAKYVSGESPVVAADFASEFVIDCIKETGDDHPYGACFETVLKNRTK